MFLELTSHIFWLPLHWFCNSMLAQFSEQRRRDEKECAGLYSLKDSYKHISLLGNTSWLVLCLYCLFKILYIVFWTLNKETLYIRIASAAGTVYFRAAPTTFRFSSIPDNCILFLKLHFAANVILLAVQSQIEILTVDYLYYGTQYITYETATILNPPGRGGVVAARCKTCKQHLKIWFVIG